MTKKKVIRKPRPTKPKPQDPTQADRILAVFARWLAAEPGRRIALEYDGRARTWVVTADTRYQGLGVSLVDASAQIATAVAFDEGAR